MSQNLPTGGFDEIELTKKIDRNLLKTILRTAGKKNSGYFLERDLEYPCNIHEKTNYFRFPPDKKYSK